MEYRALSWREGEEYNWLWIRRGIINEKDSDLQSRGFPNQSPYGFYLNTKSSICF
ncbi:hypothetical protein SPPR111872_20055 [Sphingobacterium prati]